MYFLNKNNIDALRERKEILEKLQVERAEWLGTLTKITDRYDLRLTAAIEAVTKLNGEMHTLRNAMTANMLSIESKLERLLGGPHAKQ